MMSITTLDSRQPSRPIPAPSRTVALAKLMDLPTETLIEILSLLDWKDVLRIRQICRRLRDDSFARPIWLGLAQRYSATIQPRPFFPEKPLELHTQRELEYLVLRWRSGKAGYSLLEEQRDFSITEPLLQGSHLLEGGRWLIFATLDGSVKYYDLNSQTESLDAVTLLPTHFNKDTITVNSLAVDLDPDAEYLTFNLASMTVLDNMKRDTELNRPQHARWIEVNRVTPYWDEDGNIKGLQADRLACFREELSCPFGSFTLRGRYVAYSLQSFRHDSGFGDGESIVIVDWTSVDPTSLIYPRKFIWGRRVLWMALLPDDRLICHDSRAVMLFDLNHAAVRNANPVQLYQPPAQAPIASFHCISRGISSPYLIDDTLRFTVVTDKNIKGLIIPCSRSVGTLIDCVDLVSNTTFKPYCKVAYDRVVGNNRSSGPVMAQFGWPDDLSSVLIQKKIQITYLPFTAATFFDSSSSRIVVYGEISRLVSTFDLTPVTDNSNNLQIDGA